MFSYARSMGIPLIVFLVKFGVKIPTYLSAFFFREVVPSLFLERAKQFVRGYLRE